MADAYGSVVKHWRAHVTGSVISQDNSSATIRATTYFQTVDEWDYASLNGKYTASVSGRSSSGSVSMGISVGDNGQQKLISKDVRISKNHGSQSIKFNGAVTITGYASGYSSAGGSVGIGPKPSYTVSYNANGGTGAPGHQTKWYGETLSLSKTVPTRTNYKFLGWGTTSGQSKVKYNPGSLYGSNKSITLYAIWKLSLVAPTIDNLKAFRCDADGNPSNNSEYVKVTCAWHVDKVADTSNVGVTLSIIYDSVTDSNALTGTSGTFAKIYPSISASISHLFSVTLTDKHMNVKSSCYVGPSYLIIDINADGSGVGIGQAAPAKGIVVCGTFFANSIEGLPTTPADVGPKGTRAIVAGHDYVFNGSGAWRPCDTTVISKNLTDFFTPASGWSEMYPGECSFIISNGMAHVSFSLTGTLPKDVYTNVGTLKAGYRPIRNFRISGPINGGYTYGGWARPDGVVNIGNKTGANREWFAVDCTFQLADLPAGSLGAVNSLN